MNKATKKYTVDLTKMNGKAEALRIAEECLRYSKAGGTIAYADEVDPRAGNAQNQRVSKNINFWTEVVVELKRA